MQYWTHIEGLHMDIRMYGMAVTYYSNFVFRLKMLCRNTIVITFLPETSELFNDLSLSLFSRRLSLHKVIPLKREPAILNSNPVDVFFIIDRLKFQFRIPRNFH